MNNLVNIAAGKLTALKSNAVRLFEAKKPELALAGGCIFIAAGIFLACKATYKMDEVINEHNETLERINECAKTQPSYTKEDQLKDKSKLYLHTAKGMIIVYSKALLCIAAGFGLIFYSNSEKNRRYAKLFTYAKGIETAYTKLEERLKEVLGEEEANKIIFDSDTYEQRQKILDESGEKVKQVPYSVSPYEIFFDEASEQWTKSASNNRFFVTGRLKVLNANLHCSNERFIPLEEVLEELGFRLEDLGYEQMAKDNQILGWYYLKDHPIYGQTFIDFGLCDEDEITREFLEGRNRYVLLRFNCSLIDWEDVKRFKKEQRKLIKG